MASTYSALKIELIADGEQTNVWGDTTNTNLGTALEEAIVGRANPNFTTDGTLIISLTNTNSSQTARNYILNCTSSVSLTTTQDLIVPSIEKPYIVENNTTGSQSIRVKTVAGTGITIPNGKTAMVYADGVNVVSALSYIPAATIDTATIATAAIAAGTATFSAATITTATINGGTITGITDLTVANGGTGLSTLTANNVILGNGASSPTFVAPGTVNNVLTSNGTTWVSSAVAAGVSSFSAGSTGFTPNTATTGAVTLAGQLDVDNGGTGSSSLTLNSVLIGNNTSPLLAVAPGVSGRVLTSNGTAWTSAALPANVASISFGTTGLTPNTATTGIVTVAGNLAVANGGTGAITVTGSGANVLGASPTLSSPSISSAVMTTMASSVITSATAKSTATCTFTGTVLGTALTATSITGTITVGQLITGTGVTAGTTIISGSGANWVISPSQNVTAAMTVVGIDFTGIPSWAKRITVLLSGVSTSGTSSIIIRLGDSGGIEITGYAGRSKRFASTTLSTPAALTTASILVDSTSAAATCQGECVITNISGNEWIFNSAIGTSTDDATYTTGSKTLSAVLTQLRITTENGTDTFDAGSINIIYE